MIGSDHDSVGSPLKGKWPSQRGTHGNKGAFWIWSGKTPARGAILHLFCFTVGYFYIFFISARNFLWFLSPGRYIVGCPVFAFKVRWTRGVCSCWEYYAVWTVRLKLIKRRLMIYNARLPVIIINKKNRFGDYSHVICHSLLVLCKSIKKYR